MRRIAAGGEKPGRKIPIRVSVAPRRDTLSGSQARSSVG